MKLLQTILSILQQNLPEQTSSFKHNILYRKSSDLTFPIASENDKRSMHGTEETTDISG